MEFRARKAPSLDRARSPSPEEARHKNASGFQWGRMLLFAFVVVVNLVVYKVWIDPSAMPELPRITETQVHPTTPPTIDAAPPPPPPIHPQGDLPLHVPSETNLVPQTQASPPSELPQTQTSPPPEPPIQKQTQNPPEPLQVAVKENRKPTRANTALQPGTECVNSVWGATFLVDNTGGVCYRGDINAQNCCSEIVEQVHCSPKQTTSLLLHALTSPKQPIPPIHTAFVSRLQLGARLLHVV